MWWRQDNLFNVINKVHQASFPELYSSEKNIGTYWTTCTPMTSYLWSVQNRLILSADHNQSRCRKMPKMCSGEKKDYYIVIIKAIIHVQFGYIYMRIYVPEWKPYWLDIFGQTNWWDKCQHLQLWCLKLSPQSLESPQEVCCSDGRSLPVWTERTAATSSPRQHIGDAWPPYPLVFVSGHLGEDADYFLHSSVF